MAIFGIHKGLDIKKRNGLANHRTRYIGTQTIGANDPENRSKMTTIDIKNNL